MYCRHATEDDYPAICRLLTSAEELFLVYPAGQFPLTVKQLRELSKWRIGMTVALVDEQVVGFANFYNHKPGESVFLGNVVIAASERGQGYGRALIEYMIDQARGELALPELHLSVFNSNTAALLLYAQMGFEPYAIERRSGLGGQPSGLLHMRMLLGVHFGS